MMMNMPATMISMYGSQRSLVTRREFAVVDVADDDRLWTTTLMAGSACRAR